MAPHWDQYGWVASRPGSCKWAALPLRIEPGELATVRTPVTPPAEILGDSLPAGSYAAAVRVRLTAPRDTTFIVGAGTA